MASVGAGLGTSNSARSGPGRSPGDDGEIAEPGSGPEAPSEPGGLMTLAPVSFVTRLFERRPFEEGTFEVEGLRLQYERHGEGSRVLVFLHGLLLDNQLSRRLAADLADRGFQVVLLDLPGHGGSDKPRHASAHRMDSYARYVVALLDELGIDKAVVGGVSLGANVSLQVAVQAPERVQGLLIEMPVLEWAVPGAAVVFLPMLLGVHYAAPVVRLVASLARRLPRTTVAPLDSVVTMITAEPEEIAAVLHGMLVGPITPTYEARHAITAPALVIGHRIDFIHPFTDADHLTRQLQHARLVEARSIFELRVAPDRLTAEIAEFLDDTWGEGTGPHALDPAPRAKSA
ncbi:MAG: alpha/beta hydrolase [Acidimicrobiales bacterium]